jgi:hypothetical protein
MTSTAPRQSPAKSEPADLQPVRSSPRDFAIHTGYAFQTVGSVLLLGSCCIWSLSGRWITKVDRPTAHWTDHLQGDRLPAAVLTIAIAASLIGGAGLIGVGIGLHGERPGSGRAAMVVTGAMAIIYGCCAVTLFWAKAIGGAVISAGFAVFATLLLLLAAGSASVLRRFPPPPDQNRVTDDILRQLSRRQDPGS